MSLVVWLLLQPSLKNLIQTQIFPTPMKVNHDYRDKELSISIVTWKLSVFKTSIIHIISDGSPPDSQTNLF